MDNWLGSHQSAFRSLLHLHPHQKVYGRVSAQRVCSRPRTPKAVGGVVSFHFKKLVASLGQRTGLQDHQVSQEVGALCRSDCPGYISVECSFSFRFCLAITCGELYHYSTQGLCYVSFHPICPRCLSTPSGTSSVRTIRGSHKRRDTNFVIRSVLQRFLPPFYISSKGSSSSPFCVLKTARIYFGNPPNLLVSTPTRYPTTTQSQKCCEIAN